MSPQPTARRRYVWPRFWTKPGEHIDDGFFPDGASMFSRPRDAPQLRDLVDEPCLILLGEPGLGKSHAIADAVEELRHVGNDVHVVDMGAYEDGESLIGAIVDDLAWRTWRTSDGVLFLFLDGLDEALLHVKAIHRRLIVELKKLDGDISRLRLRISCRSAEWLPDFDAQLADLFGSTDASQRLTLAPLRAVDAATAAQAEGIDANHFLAEIFERDLGRLAAFPLTLRMMVDIAASDEGALPQTQAQLFDGAILRLAEEHNTGRRREQTGKGLHVGQRVVVAERIAGCLLLAGKAAVDSNLATPSGSDLSIRELQGFSEEDPVAAGGASFRVNAEQIQEVLATSLFVDVGGGRLVFVHRSLAEYLAARYLAHHDMDAEQVMSLLASAEDPDGRLIPQLREVAAWAAMFDEDVLAAVMDREPELVLRIDSLPMTDAVRARIVDSLLTDEAAVRIARYDRRVRKALGNLVHPGLSDQVREALRPGASVPTRQMAFTVAQAAALPELQPDLVAFAFDATEPAFLRDDAVRALTDYADDETRAALVPLATERIEDDVDDEIKGQALLAAFPSRLGTAEVLRVLTPARNEHLFGAYKMFLSRTFPSAIRTDELSGALQWATTVPRDHGPTDVLASLTDDILAAAWPHLDDDQIRAGVMNVIKPRLMEHHELLGPLHDSNDKRTFQEPQGRHLLIKDLMQVGVGGDLDFTWMGWSKPPLLVDEDYQWVIGELRATVGSPAEASWATLASSLFRPETCDVEEMFQLAALSATFGRNTAWWRTAVALDSEAARMWRKRAERQQERPPSPDAPDMDCVIRDRLDAIEAGDLDAWWRLNLELLYDKHGRGTNANELEADLTRLDGWARADQDTRARILAAARQYLQGAPPDPQEWFNERTVDRPAWAGYRALHLLATQHPAQIEALDPDAWARWMPIVVSYPRPSGAEDGRTDDLLVTLASDRAPDELAHWTLRMVDAQNAGGEGHLFILWRLRHVATPELVAALALKLKEPKLKPQARADLTEFGMRTDPRAFLPSVADLLSPKAIELDREAAVMVAAAAWGRAPSTAWPLIEALFRMDNELGKLVFERVAGGERVDLAGPLDDESLSRLVEWLFENFPPAEDPSLQAGASYPTRRGQAGEARERLLGVLAERGTDQAIATIDALALAFPSHGMMYRKAAAQEARLARWTAPKPRDVILLAQSNDARIVLSDGHLQQAVMASLRRIEKRLQESSPSTARELWNTRGKPTPKHEEELSTWLKGRLEEDLRVGGRIIGRELEVRPNQTGRGRGESVDITVFAPVGTEVEDAATASVSIEVKGCWHADVNTAMQSQLVDRYLTGTATTHGIYLVFWFSAEDWDPRDGRRRRCIRDPQRLHAKLADQARALSASRPATVCSFVLDGSLPPRAGRARRIRRALGQMLGTNAQLDGA